MSLTFKSEDLSKADYSSGWGWVSFNLLKILIEKSDFLQNLRDSARKPPLNSKCVFFLYVQPADFGPAKPS
jgi:hypothetical protein